MHPTAFTLFLSLRRPGAVLALLWTPLLNPGASGAEPESALRIRGADRMTPLVKKLAERFYESRQGAPIRIEVSSVDPAAAVISLAGGGCDVAMLDRPLRDDEVARLRRTRGAEPSAIPIAMDAVVMLVHPENPLESLTLKQAGEVWSYRVTRWTDLGVPYQDHDIRRIGLQPDSGAIDLIVRRTMGGSGFARSESTKFTATDVADQVARNQWSFGYATLGDLLTAKVVPLRLTDTSEPILPTDDAVRSMRYPLAHYLYLVFPGPPEGPAGEFLAFVVGREGQTIIDASRPGPMSLPFQP